MAIQCQMSLNVLQAVANQSPSPMATLTVFNPNASSVAVTGIDIQFFDALGNPVNVAANKPIPAMGPGQTVVVTTLGTLTFGPFPIAVAIAGSANQFYALPEQTATNPLDLPIAQLAHPPQRLIQIGATVNASDGSINTAGRVGLLVSFANPPPVGYQGGDGSYSNPNNTLGGIVRGTL